MTFSYLEKIIKDYPRLKEEIDRRKLEVIFPHRESDVNAGIKGNRQTDPTALNLVITLDEDERIRALERQYRVISRKLDDLPPASRLVIDMRYFQPSKAWSWDDIAEETSYSRRQCFRVRDDFVREIGEALGIL